MSKNIEIIYSPAECQYHQKGGSVVLIDVVRFTSTLITALANGAISAEAYPNSEIPLKLKKEKNYIIAGEKMGKDIPGFDFNNSPVDMTKENVFGRELAFCTTNGTYTRSLIENYDNIFAGSFINASALAKRLIQEDKNVTLVCSGRGRKVAVEDLIFAGFIAKKLIEEGDFTYLEDGVSLAILLWENAKNNPHDFVINNSPQIKLVLDQNPKYKADYETIFDIDKFDVVPQEIAPLKFVVKK